MVDKELVFDFLAGVNIEFDQIRLQVLDRDPFPTLKQITCTARRKSKECYASLGCTNRSSMVAMSPKLNVLQVKGHPARSYLL